MTESQSNRVALFLLLSVIATLLLYFVVPFGRLIAYPLVLLSTLAHELGHGIAAVLVGGDFEQFVMHDMVPASLRQARPMDFKGQSFSLEDWSDHPLSRR